VINYELLKAAGIDLSPRSHLAEGIELFWIPGGTRAIKTWQSLASQSKALGGWPLILGDPENLKSLKNSLSRSSPEERKATLDRIPTSPPLRALKEVARSKAIKVLENVRTKKLDLPQILKEHFEQQATQAIQVDPPPACTESFAQWTSTASATRWHPAVPFDSERKPLTECLIAIILDTAPADVAAILNFGGWNDCPDSILHVAFARDWNLRYGAVPVCMTHDIIELHVPRPPSAAPDAFTVAWEQSVYCPDLIYQGTNTVERLAQEIWGSPFWYFWWD